MLYLHKNTILTLKALVEPAAKSREKEKKGWALPGQLLRSIDSGGERERGGCHALEGGGGQANSMNLGNRGEREWGGRERGGGGEGGGRKGSGGGGCQALGEKDRDRDRDGDRDRDRDRDGDRDRERGESETLSNGKSGEVEEWGGCHTLGAGGGRASSWRHVKPEWWKPPYLGLRLARVSKLLRLYSGFMKALFRPY